MISSEGPAEIVRRAYEMVFPDYINLMQVLYTGEQNTTALCEKQRRLITLITNQVYEKEKRITV